MAVETSKEELQTFNPRDPAYRFKLWTRVATPKRSFWYFYWRRIALILPVFALAGWFAAAAALCLFLKFERGFKEVSYGNIALPWRWSRHRVALGHHYVNLATKEWEQQHYFESLNHLRAGVARLPNDLPTRRLLAYAYVAFGRMDLALNTLVNAVDYAKDDIYYLKFLFGLLFQAQEDERAASLARQLLPPKPDQKITHLFVALQAATANYYRGRYDQAEHIIRAWTLDRSVEGQLLLAKADWERGYPDLALFRLEQEIARSPQRDELHLQLVRCYRELGYRDQARQHALLRHFNDPVSPGPRIDLIYAYSVDDDRAAAREINTYLTAFSRDPAALLLLAWFGVDSDNLALVRRVHGIARVHKFSLNSFNLALVEAELGAQDYSAALVSANAALHDEKEKNPHFAPLLAGLRAVAFFGLKDTQRAELQLDAFLNRADLRANDALLLAKQLGLLGYKAVARHVLATAAAADPLNQAVLSELVRLDVALGNREALMTNLPPFLAMRKPSHAVLQEALLMLNRPEDVPLCQKIRAVLDLVTDNPVPED